MADTVLRFDFHNQCAHGKCRRWHQKLVIESVDMSKTPKRNFETQTQRKRDCYTKFTPPITKKTSEKHNELR
jgi:hypothetical protein